MPEPRQPNGDVLFAPLAAMGYDGLSAWAWANYRDTIVTFARLVGSDPPRLLEIGAGRAPLFSAEESGRLAFEVTLNDIDVHELAMAPSEFAKELFDVGGDVPQLEKLANRYDVIFSKMVFEHVPNARRAWKNVHRMLAPGGVAIAFIPTLYSPPFVLNKVLPERVSRAVLKFAFADRAQLRPKFPAYYDACVALRKPMNSMLAACGFSDSLVLPFWTHGYFHKVPLLRTIDSIIQSVSRKYGISALTSYAYILARK